MMHQYHLGIEDDETEGEYVVSKILYQQQKQPETDDNGVSAVEDSKAMATPYCPKTPKTVKLNPLRGSSVLYDDAMEESILSAVDEGGKNAKKEYCIPPSGCQAFRMLGRGVSCSNPDLNDIDDSLHCKEIFNSCALDDFICQNDLNDGCYNGYGFNDLDNIQLDTQPDFQLTDLQFCSQDIMFDWLDQ